jgi:magnesium chelatase family protein
MHIEVSPVKYTELNASAAAESSQEIRLRILAARKIQQQRYQDTGPHANAHMSRRQVEECCQLSPESQKVLQSAMKKLGLSARAYERILKVARTIADLEASPNISTAHLSEAIQYRNLDRSN